MTFFCEALQCSHTNVILMSLLIRDVISCSVICCYFYNGEWAKPPNVFYEFTSGCHAVEIINWNFGALSMQPQPTWYFFHFIGFKEACYIAASLLLLDTR